MEEWRNIEDYDDYQVSNLGRVRSLDRWVNNYGNSKQFIKGRILKPYKGNHGYLNVALFKNGKGKWCTVHRLVAQAFIENPDNLPCINHRDECKTNNHVDNLEWCSYQYNANYGTKMKRISEQLKGRNNIKLSKTVYQYSLDGVLIKEWLSAAEVKRQLGYNRQNINQCCLGKRKTAYGYIWKYAS